MHDIHTSPLSDTCIPSPTSITFDPHVDVVHIGVASVDKQVLDRQPDDKHNAFMLPRHHTSVSIETQTDTPPSPPPLHPPTHPDAHMRLVDWLYNMVAVNYYSLTNQMQKYTHQSKQPVQLDLFCICLVLGVAEATRGIVIPTLSSFVASLNGSTFMLSCVVAVFSVGRLLASFAYGYLLDRDVSTRIIMISAIVVSCLGNLIYMMADEYMDSGLLVIGRFMTGYGTGVLTVARTYVTRTYSHDKHKCTLIMSVLGVVQFCGFTLTPVIGGMDINFTMFGVFEINQYLFGSWLCMLVDILLLLLLPLAMTADGGGKQAVQAVVPEKAFRVSLYNDNATNDVEMVSLTPRKRLVSFVEAHEYVSASDDDDDDDEANQPMQNRLPDNNAADSCSQSVAEANIAVITDIEAQQSTTSLPAQQSAVTSSTRTTLQHIKSAMTEAVTFIRLNNTACLCILLNGVTRGVLSVAESFGVDTYIMAQKFKEDDAIEDAGMFYSVMGLIGCAMFLSVSTLTKHFTPYAILMVGLVCSATGFATLIVVHNHLSQARLVAGSLCIWAFGSPLVQTVLVSIFSQTLAKSADTLAKTGMFMGIFTAAGSVGRILVPIISGSLYTTYGQPAAYLFASLCVVLVSVATFTQRKHLRPAS